MCNSLGILLGYILLGYIQAWTLSNMVLMVWMHTSSCRKGTHNLQGPSAAASFPKLASQWEPKACWYIHQLQTHVTNVQDAMSHVPHPTHGVLGDCQSTWPAEGDATAQTSQANKQKLCTPAYEVTLHMVPLHAGIEALSQDGPVHAANLMSTARSQQRCPRYKSPMLAAACAPTTGMPLLAPEATLASTTDMVCATANSCLSG